MTDSERATPTLYSCWINFFVYLERFRRYSTFCIWLGFPYWGLNFGGFGAKWPSKRQIREKNLLGWHFLAPNCVFWVFMREIIYPFGLCRCARKQKAGKKAGRRKSHKKCIFHVRVEQPLAGEFQPNLAYVFVSRTSSNVQNFIVIAWEVSELWGIEVFMLPYGTKAVLNTLLSATALQVITYRELKQCTCVAYGPIYDENEMQRVDGDLNVLIKDDSLCSDPTSLIHSKLDYCNSLFLNLPQCQLGRLQLILNSSVRAVSKLPNSPTSLRISNLFTGSKLSRASNIKLFL